jgi:carbon monoxide dehydrogenase subunit G
MQMSAERRLEAPREKVWAALNDVEVLKRSIPGCKTLEWLDDEVIKAQVRAKIGPIDTVFKGQLKLSQRDPPNGYRLSGEGNGAAAGFASGNAVIRLQPDGEGTLLQYDVDAMVGGKLAQLGSRLIDAAAMKFAEDFFERFAGQVAPPPVDAEETGLVSQPARAGLKPVLWVPLLIALVFLMLFVFAKP